MVRTTLNLDVIKILMEGLFEGKYDAKYVIEKWPNPEKALNANEALLIHELHHFYADADIRARDKDYALLQIENLKKRYSALI